MEFALAGVAAMGACVFTNPLEVLKTRLQLQGELRAKGQHAVHYRNVAHAAYVVASNDGILALQKGLVPAVWVQLVLNGTRLGMFKWLENRGYFLNSRGEPSFWRTVVFSGIGGAAGQWLCSPLFLVKTHLQSQAASTIAVGHQYKHHGMMDALANIFKDHGVRGLFRGAGAGIPRAFVGSTCQLTSFDYVKRLLLKDYPSLFADQPVFTAFLASMVAGVAISVSMTPFDLICTRLYNQPTDSRGKGTLYSGYADCVTKIYKSEGLSAFYKGVGPMYLRLGPHTVLCLIFWEQLTELYNKHFGENQEKKKLVQDL